MGMIVGNTSIAIARIFIPGARSRWFLVVYLGSSGTVLYGGCENRWVAHDVGEKYGINSLKSESTPLAAEVSYQGIVSFE